MSAAARYHGSKTKWPPNIIFKKKKPSFVSNLCVYKLLDKRSKIIITLSMFCQNLFVIYLFCIVCDFYLNSQVPENRSEVRLSGTSEFKKKGSPPPPPKKKKKKKPKQPNPGNKTTNK